MSNSNNLERLSKADLIWVIRRMSSLGNEYYLKQAMNDLRYEKELQRITEAEKYSRVANEARLEYIALLEPYDGVRLVDIPIDVLNTAEVLMKEARAADKQCMRLMSIGKENVNDRKRKRVTAD